MGYNVKLRYVRPYLFSLFLTVYTVVGASVSAQTQQTECWPHCESVLMRPIVETDPPMTKEAFFEYCENDTKLNMMFDCSCWSERYDETRVVLGQNGGHSAVLEEIVDLCIDTERAGEIEHAKCLASPPMTFIPTEKYSVDAFCSCYGDKYAQIYKDAKPPYPEATLNNFKLEAVYVCRDPQ